MTARGALPPNTDMKTYDEVLRYYDGLVHTTFTRWPSYLQSYVNYDSLFNYRATGETSASIIVANALESILRMNAPVVAQHWANCQVFVKKARQTITNTNNRNIQELIISYNSDALDEPEEDEEDDLKKQAEKLKVYRSACAEFRKGMGNMICHEMREQRETVNLTIQAGPWASEITNIIARMNNKRAIQLSALSVGAAHYNDVQEGLSLSGAQFSLPFAIDKRRSTLNSKGEDVAEAKKNELGPRWLPTADINSNSIRTI